MYIHARTCHIFIFNGAQKLYTAPGPGRFGSVCLLTNIQLYPKPRYLIVYCTACIKIEKQRAGGFGVRKEGVVFLAFIVTYTISMQP